MPAPELLAELEALLGQVEEAQRSTALDIDEGLQHGERLRDATRTIAESSSGSWVGWHSRMYYEDYAEPPVAESWSTEWGAAYGISPLWRERTLREVEHEIESAAGTSLAVLAGYANRVREKCQPLQREVITLLSPVCDLADLAKEAKLLEEIEGIHWIVSPIRFIEAIRPTQIWSRDSKAMSQGIQVPLHLNVEAAIVSNTSTLSAGRRFLNDAIRLVRQVRSKLKSGQSFPKTGPATASSGSRLVRQLRNRSIVLFLVLAAVIVAGTSFVALRLVENSLADAAIIVGTALLIAGVYAALLDRGHAIRALGFAAAIGSAVATLQQLLEA